MRVQLGMPLDPEHEDINPSPSTTGGFFPNVVCEVPKKASPPTVPLEVKLAVARFKPYFDPAFFPMVRFLCCTDPCIVLV